MLVKRNENGTHEKLDGWSREASGPYLDLGHSIHPEDQIRSAAIRLKAILAPDFVIPACPPFYPP